MFKLSRLFALSLTINLLACSPAPLSVLAPHNSIQQTLPSYLFSPKAFTIAMNAEEEKALLSRVKADFEADLAAQDLGAYSNSSDFKILLLAGTEGNHLLAGTEGNHLLAGTEGNHFESSESLDALPQDQATLAQLVLVAPDDSQTVYKGQFEQGEFVFSGDASIPPDHTAYLLAVNQKEQIDTFKGELLTPDSDPEKEDTTPPEKTPVSPPTPPTYAHIKPNNPNWVWKDDESWLWKDDNNWVWKDSPRPLMQSAPGKPIMPYDTLIKPPEAMMMPNQIRKEERPFGYIAKPLIRRMATRRAEAEAKRQAHLSKETP